VRDPKMYFGKETDYPDYDGSDCEGCMEAAINQIRCLDDTLISYYIN
jgi:hypothetical protein